MTRLLRPNFAQTGSNCKTSPWQMVLVIRQSRDVWALLAGNVDYAFIGA
jgi:UDP-N-acetylmuramoylalanine-D-glutamate ligase